MIPKKIHYCWFGGNPLPETAIKCIESWKKYCPDYEIIEWNEKNFDINKCNYIREAYEAKKWAFVSDYARFDILYQHGGIYFDTDVELIKPIENILVNGSFMGFEKQQIRVKVAPGLGMGAVKNLKFYKEILEYYDKVHFKNENGEYNQTTIVEYTTNLLKKYGLKEENYFQTIENINIYPVEYFCPMDYDSGKIFITNKTISIHHYTSSWHSEKEKKIKNFERKIINKLGEKKGNILIKNIFYMLIKNIYIKGIKKTLIQIYRKVF